MDNISNHESWEKVLERLASRVAETAKANNLIE